MNNLPPDLQRKTALELSAVDLINLCATDKIFNKNICNSDDFWLEKLKLDYPSEFLPVYDRGEKLENPKSLYIGRFTEISKKIEEHIPEFIEMVYGKTFQKYLSPNYEKDLYKKFYDIYLQLKNYRKEKPKLTNEQKWESKASALDKITDLLPILLTDIMDIDKARSYIYDFFRELKFIDLKNDGDLKLLNRLKSGKFKPLVR